MKFGIFLPPYHALNENPAAALDRDIALLAHLDWLGFDEAWIGEHHSGGFEIIASPELFIANVAQRTRRIRLGTGVVSLPYHHPLMVADRMMLLDHLTKGRAMFGMGAGVLASDAAQMGISPADQRRMMVEGMEAVIRLLRGEILSMETGWFSLREARVHLPAYSEPGIEMAVACARSPAGALAAGRWGIPMLAIGGSSPDSLKFHLTNWQIYAECARENGHQPDRSRWRMGSLMHLAETRERAFDNVRFGLVPWARYLKEVTSFEFVPPDSPDPAGYVVEHGVGIIGTPDDAIRHIEQILDGTGGFGVHLDFAHNWADWESTKRSYELFARYVIPHFKGTLQSRRASYDFCVDNRESFAAATTEAVQAANRIVRTKPG